MNLKKRNVLWTGINDGFQFRVVNALPEGWPESSGTRERQIIGRVAENSIREAARGLFFLKKKKYYFYFNTKNILYLGIVD